jgi:hypothetical protein
MKNIFFILVFILSLSVSQAQVITIPTVVHVVYNTAAQNVSNTMVQDLITVLNQDYSRTNPDTINTPAAFLPIAANPEIQFCLAQTDPNGNATNGIIHTQTTVTSFAPNNPVKYTAQGGADAWDVTKYFNIWICNLGSGLFGYSEFPTATPSNTYGAVLHYSTLPGSTWPTYNTGRAGTYFVGHCLNLYRIDESSDCVDKDSVSDTPTPYSTYFSCPAYPFLDSCNATLPGNMFMNFMAMGDETCKNMFTNGQKARMRAVLTNPPYNALASSPGCYAVGMKEDKLNISLSVYPNPFSSQTILQTDFPLHNATLTLENYFGQTVLQLDNLSQQSITLNCEHLSNGLYILRLHQDQKVIATQKLVVQNN